MPMRTWPRSIRRIMASDIPGYGSVLEALRNGEFTGQGLSESYFQTGRRDGTRSDRALRHRETGEERGERIGGREWPHRKVRIPCFTRFPPCRSTPFASLPPPGAPIASVNPHASGGMISTPRWLLPSVHGRQRRLDTTRQLCCRRDRDDPSFTRNGPAGRRRSVPDGTGCIGKPAADPDRPQRRAGCSPAFLDPARAGMARRANGDDRTGRHRP
jgi:hypothetical protein